MNEAPPPTVPGPSLRTLVTVMALGGVAFLVALGLGHLSGIGSEYVVSDLYEATGTRLSGLVTLSTSMMGIAAAAITFFAAALLPRLGSGTGRSSGLLVFLGAAAMVLAVDDWLGIHESVDDAIRLVVPFEPSHGVKSLLELGVFAVYGLLALGFGIHFRRELRATPWWVLASGLGLLGVSLFVDMLPDSLLERLPIPAIVLMVIEDGAKVVGLVTIAVYLVTVAAGLVLVVARDRSAPSD